MKAIPPIMLLATVLEYDTRFVKRFSLVAVLQVVASKLWGPGVIWMRLFCHDRTALCQKFSHLGLRCNNPFVLQHQLGFQNFWHTAIR